jgi:hypothetical protein
VLATSQVLLSKLDDIPRAEGHQEIPGTKVTLQAIYNSCLIREIRHGRSA